MLSDILIRPIRPGDNPAIARIIRDSLTEFGANRPGTVYYDPTTDALFELFQQERSAYWVAELADRIVGGAVSSQRLACRVIPVNWLKCTWCPKSVVWV
ncbi:MAG: hypothetical protein SFU20_04540 [Chitinophagaceae bacterium]|nr:hypothetical protein [Chitinophagaceae bacterium]